MKTVKTFIISILGLCLSFLMLVIYLSSIQLQDIRWQTNHLESLKKSYQFIDFEPVDESIFYDFELSPDIKLNDLQYLASHNSYKKKGSNIGHFFVGLGSSMAEAKAMNYSNHTLTDQLKLGIRSFEFDTRLRKNEFMLTHVPLVDNSSVAPFLKYALEEIRLFSEYHKNHLPIIILLEIKDDWMVLDPSLQTIGQKELNQLNELVFNQLGSHLFKPSDMMNHGLFLKEEILNHGWPSVESLLGKVIVVLHAGSFVIPYVSIDNTLFKLAMFPSVYASDEDVFYQSFIIENNPYSEYISSLVDNDFMIRTRLDENLIVDLQRRSTGLISKAQILTSDFTVSRHDLTLNQLFFFENYKTVRLRP